MSCALLAIMNVVFGGALAWMFLLPIGSTTSMSEAPSVEIIEVQPAEESSSGSAEGVITGENVEIIVSIAGDVEFYETLNEDGGVNPTTLTDQAYRIIGQDKSSQWLRVAYTDTDGVEYAGWVLAEALGFSLDNVEGIPIYEGE